MQTANIAGSKACVNCDTKRARWNSIYCSGTCKSQFLASLQADEDDDEDPPCECHYIAADVADASLCLVHGGAR